MVQISIEGDRLNFSVEGWDKLWAMRSQLSIPLEHVREARIDPEPARGWWHGLKLLGTQLPGLVTAGSFYQSEGVVFYDVHDPERTIVLELDHENYSRLIVEVENPADSLALINGAIAGRKD